MSTLIVDEAMLREPGLLSQLIAPLGPVTLNTAHPCSSALAWLYLLDPAHGLRRLGGSKGFEKLTPFSPAWKGHPGGLGLYCSSNTKATLNTGAGILETSTGNGLGDFTTLIVAAPVANAVSVLKVMLINRELSYTVQWGWTVNCYHTPGSTVSTTSGASGYLSFYTFSPPVYARSIYFSNQCDSKTHCWVVRRLGGVFALWRDGVLQGVQDHSANVADTHRTTDQYLCIDGYPDFNDRNSGSLVQCIAGWDVALPDTYAALISRDPYALLIPA